MNRSLENNFSDMIGLNSSTFKRLSHQKALNHCWLDETVGLGPSTIHPAPTVQIIIIIYNHEDDGREHNDDPLFTTAPTVQIIIIIYNHEDDGREHNDDPPSTLQLLCR